MNVWTKMDNGGLPQSHNHTKTYKDKINTKFNLPSKEFQRINTAYLKPRSHRPLRRHTTTYDG